MKRTSKHIFRDTCLAVSAVLLLVVYNMYGREYPSAIQARYENWLNKVASEFKEKGTISQEIVLKVNSKSINWKLSSEEVAQDKLLRVLSLINEADIIDHLPESHASTNVAFEVQQGNLKFLSELPQNEIVSNVKRLTLIKLLEVYQNDSNQIENDASELNQG